MRIFYVVLALAAAHSVAHARDTHWAPREYVPDAKTATAIARAVLIPIYGSDQINIEEPLTAKRVGNTWIVEGSAPRPEPGSIAPGETFVWAGGVAEVRLSAKDGRILLLTHGQ